jgi:hypothetical protein
MRLSTAQSTNPSPPFSASIHPPLPKAFGSSGT